MVLMKVIGFILGMCNHDWTKWKLDKLERYEEGKKIKVEVQRRNCKKCGYYEQETMDFDNVRFDNEYEP